MSQQVVIAGAPLPQALGTLDSPTFQGLTVTKPGTGTIASFNGAASTNSVKVIVGNPSGNVNLFIAGATNAFMTGVVQGDTGIFFSTGDNLHIGHTNQLAMLKLLDDGSINLDQGTLFVDAVNARTGFGTILPDRLIHAEVLDTITNAVTPAMRLSHVSSGTVANGFGTSLEFELEGADTTNLVAGEIACLWDDSATGTEDAQLSMRVSIAGAIAVEAARFDANATAGNTRFMIYDVDNATLERVSVGAADSGGIGKKVLVINN